MGRFKGRKRYPDPSPPQGQLDLGPYALEPPAPSSALTSTCDAGRTRHTQDQYRCPRCGVIWDVDEPRPPCYGGTAT
jgi:hypothetical protein